MKKPLTRKQEQVLSWIRAYAREYEGDTPTLSWLRGKMEVKTVNAIVEHLDGLERKGYISRRKHAKKNNIRVLDNADGQTSLTQVPVVASVGCDDLSVYANESYDETLPVANELINKSDKVVVVRAMGESMNDAGINDGDYVLVELADDANNGDRVVAIIDNMITVKKIEKRENSTVLWPVSDNPNYKPIVMNKDFKIAGRVIDTIERPSGHVTFEPISN